MCFCERSFEHAANSSTAMIASSEPKRRRFAVQVRPPPRRVKVPQAKDICLGARHVAPTNEVAAKLRASPLVIGLDIETHDLLGRHMKWWIGPLGFATLSDPLTIQEARIVQIGWSVHAAGGEPIVKEFLVRPTGFHISNVASAMHDVTEEKATSLGASLQEVLIEFMRDVSETRSLGGRLVAHHLEFDAGIVMEELARAGLNHLQYSWRKFAQGGVCTMDPDIAHWTRDMCSMEQLPWKSALKLDVMCSKLLPECKGLMSKRHSAGTDAQLVTMLFHELSQRATTRALASRCPDGGSAMA